MTASVRDIADHYAPEPEPQHHDSDVILNENPVLICASPWASEVPQRRVGGAAIGCKLQQPLYFNALHGHLADDERQALPSHHRWGSSTSQSRPKNSSMRHLPNSAGDKDRLE
jgi:hypothetical protein